jgi:hypothetical protein
MALRKRPPMVITGGTSKGPLVTPPQKPQLSSVDRTRVSIDLSAHVSLLLDHVCEVTGSNKSQLVLSALMDALPALLERSDALQKRSASLTQSQATKRR